MTKRRPSRAGRKLKIFIGWSDLDPISAPTARALLLLLESMLGPDASIWTARMDLRNGEDWRREVQQAATRANVGIFCATEVNCRAPWMSFEAGLIMGNPARPQGSSKRRIIPLLIGTERKDLMSGGPFGAFQCCFCNEAEIRKLVWELSSHLRRPFYRGNRFDEHFSNSWKAFAAAIGQAASEAKQQASEWENDRVSPKVSEAYHALTRLADVLAAALPKGARDVDASDISRSLIDAILAQHASGDEMKAILEKLNRRVPGVSKNAERAAETVLPAEEDSEAMVDEANTKLDQLEQRHRGRGEGASG